MQFWRRIGRTSRAKSTLVGVWAGRAPAQIDMKSILCSKARLNIESPPGIASAYCSPLLFLIDLRVIDRHALSVLSSNRIRPALAVFGNHGPLSCRHLALELVRQLECVVVNLLPGDRILVGTQAAIDSAFPGNVLAIEFGGVLGMSFPAFRIDAIGNSIYSPWSDNPRRRAAFRS